MVVTSDSGASCRMVRVASTPPSRGLEMSMGTTSGMPLCRTNRRMGRSATKGWPESTRWEYDESGNGINCQPKLPFMVSYALFCCLGDLAGHRL